MSTNIYHVLLIFFIIFITLIGIVGIFLQGTTYEIAVKLDQGKRDAFIVASSLLSSDCLTDDSDYFTQENLDQLRSDNTCLQKYDVAQIYILIPESGEYWDYRFREPDVGEYDIDVAIETDIGEIKSGVMSVKI